MSVMDQETTEDYQQRAAESHAATLAAWEREAGPIAASDEAGALAAAGPGEYAAAGTASFATGVIWGTVVVQLAFADGTRVEFNGKHWGLGLGGGISAGAAVFSIPAARLIGGTYYKVLTVSGVLHMTFFKGDVLVGTFNGPALSVGAAAVSGYGDWTRA